LEEQMPSRKFAEFLSDDSGHSMVEYGLVAALVSVGTIVFLTEFGTKLIANYTLFSNTMNNAMASGGGT
jgi:pilus assembly protein Flp/PilA